MDNTNNFLIGSWYKIVNIYFDGLRSTSAVQMNEPNLAADPETPYYKGHSKTNLPQKHKNAHNVTGISVSIDLLD